MARQQLLAYYFTNPTARHHLRDLAERLSIDPSNLSKELGRLERDGLFRAEVMPPTGFEDWIFDGLLYGK